MAEPIDLGLGGTLPGPVDSGGGETTETYLVQSGDTMGTIAVQLGITAEQQASWIAEVLRINDIPDARLLQAGQELALPGPVAVQPTPVPQEQPAGSGGVPEDTYTVVEGDYPVLIAEKLGIPEADHLTWAQELIALNRVSETGLIIGQVLQLPPETP